jgi:Mce-associated membrane protein
MAKHANAERQLNGSPPVVDDQQAEDCHGDEHEADEHQADDRKAQEDPGDSAESKVRQRRSVVRLAIGVGIAVVAALGSLTGWLGYRTYGDHQAQLQRNLLVEVGRQGAVNLTTISYTEADADVQRILDSSTGTFYDDFKKRSQPFLEVVKQARSKSQGTVTAAGLESHAGDRAQVLVAVSVNTTIAGAPEQQPRSWRMRISVQKVSDGAKVSNVEFVP